MADDRSEGTRLGRPGWGAGAGERQKRSRDPSTDATLAAPCNETNPASSRRRSPVPRAADGPTGGLVADDPDPR